MDKSFVESILNDRALPAFRDAFQLGRWEVHTECGRAEDSDTVAQVDCMVNYRKATLFVDAEQIKDEEDLLSAVRHEALHILLSEFQAYRRAVIELVKDSNMQEALDVVYQRCMEVMVNDVEFALDHGLGLTASEIVRRYESRKGSG